MDVKIKKLYEDAKIPTYGTPEAACADLYLHFDETLNGLIKEDEKGQYIEIHPHCTVKVGTGIATEMPDCYCALIYPRSGMATKYGLAPANLTPIVDNDYRGEWIIPVHNFSNCIRRVYNGERIAQVMFTPYIQANFIPTDRLSETKRGTGGFGSTGTM